MASANTLYYITKMPTPFRLTGAFLPILISCTARWCALVRPTRKYRINLFRLTVIVLLGYFLYVSFGHQSNMSAINQETEVMRLKLEQLKETNKKLKAEKERLQDPVHIEKMAREELGLVKPGEVPYMIPGKN